MKSRVTLVEPIDRDPFYAVHYQTKDSEPWSIAKVFTFRLTTEEEGSVWSQEKNLAAAMELAKRIELNSGETSIIIYETK